MQLSHHAAIAPAANQLVANGPGTSHRADVSPSRLHTHRCTVPLPGASVKSPGALLFAKLRTLDPSVDAADYRSLDCRPIAASKQPTEVWDLDGLRSDIRLAEEVQAAGQRRTSETAISPPEMLLSPSDLAVGRDISHASPWEAANTPSDLAMVRALFDADARREVASPSSSLKSAPGPQQRVRHPPPQKPTRSLRADLCSREESPPPAAWNAENWLPYGLRSDACP